MLPFLEHSAGFYPQPVYQFYSLSTSTGTAGGFQNKKLNHSDKNHCGLQNIGIFNYKMSKFKLYAEKTAGEWLFPKLEPPAHF